VSGAVKLKVKLVLGLPVAGSMARLAELELELAPEVDLTLEP
jgi:hypothetical protein